jgi:hypothetical protein
MRPPPWVVNSPRVDIDPSAFLLCLVVKLLLKVQLSKLAHSLWSSGEGTELTD